jgi:hypothetical protein
MYTEQAKARMQRGGIALAAIGLIAAMAHNMPATETTVTKVSVEKPAAAADTKHPQIAGRLNPEPYRFAVTPGDRWTNQLGDLIGCKNWGDLKYIFLEWDDHDAANMAPREARLAELSRSGACMMVPSKADVFVEQLNVPTKTACVRPRGMQACYWVSAIGLEKSTTASSKDFETPTP